MTCPPVHCRLSRTGQINLPAAIARRFDAAEVTCLAVSTVEPGRVSLSAAHADALANAELSIVLTMLNADLLSNPDALMPLPFDPPRYVQHRSVLHHAIDGPSGLSSGL